MLKHDRMMPYVLHDGCPRAVHPTPTRPAPLAPPSPYQPARTHITTIGCDKCGDSDGKATCKNQGKPTLPKEFITWTGMHPYPTPGYGCKVNPWCAPGSAPVFDPCGVTGGGTDPGKNGNGGVPPDFYKQGFSGSKVPWGHGPVTKWVVGQTYDVAWAITANHGGGYQYRLCPKNDAAVGGQAAEKCFQKTPLNFANANTQWIQWGDDDQTRLAIPSMTLTTLHTGEFT